MDVTSSKATDKQPMIRLENVSKTFHTASGDVNALVNVSLDIPKGSIFGIIGFSGAGKSTLVRCINLLEKPTEGKVFVDGVELTSLNESQLRASRKNIGMIFQLFNLMRSRTVYDNVAFPLKGSGLTRKQQREKIFSLLKTVGLADKAKAYPSQLSGGQKQRVAIARALASNPKVLLCDEATSALDPQTTQDILQLIKQLNRELGITTIIITHEMAVVKQICDSVAVMENGCIVEKGDIYTVFSDPRMPITRRFIGTTDGVENIKKNILDMIRPLNLKNGDKVIELSFHGDSSGHALVSTLSRSCNIDISILYGNIEMLDGKPLGKLVTVFTGSSSGISKALGMIDGENVRAEVLYNA